MYVRYGLKMGGDPPYYPVELRSDNSRLLMVDRSSTTEQMAARLARDVAAETGCGIKRHDEDEIGYVGRSHRRLTQAEAVEAYENAPEAEVSEEEVQRLSAEATGKTRG